MSDRKDYYFRQKVTEAELDSGFDTLEQADFNFAIDNEFIGVASGMGVSQASPTPNLTVDVQGPGTSYSKDGERINFSSTQNVDVSEDDGGSPTTVTTPGNAKIVSVFAVFDRALSDPRIDGNGATVYFQRDESFDFSVIQGAEAASGTEVPPPLDASNILLADITLIYGQTQVLNADISTLRREDAFKFIGGTVEIEEGTSYDAIDALLTAVNNHIDGIADNHPASAVTYSDTPTWLNGQTLDGATVVDDVQEAIAAVMSDLGLQASGNDGAIRLGKYQTPNFHDGTPVATGSVNTVIDGIVTALAAATGNGGGDKVGIGTQTSGDLSLTAGSIYDQLGELLSYVNGNYALPKHLRACNYTRIEDVGASGSVIHSIDYGNLNDASYTDRFVAVGEDGTDEVVRYSNNEYYGWATATTSTLAVEFFDVKFAESLFVAVGWRTTQAHIETSPDGSTWTSRTPTGMTATNDRLRTVSYDPNSGYFVAGGDRNGSNGNILRSADGITWAAATTLPGCNYIYDIDSDGSSTLIAATLNSSGNRALLRSTDGGDTWTTVETGGAATDGYLSVTYDSVSTRWFAAGDGVIARSDPGDPTTWTEMSIVSTDRIINCTDAVTADGIGTVVFGGGSGNMAITLDGGANFYLLAVGDNQSKCTMDGPDCIKFLAGRFFITTLGTDIFASRIALGHHSESKTWS
jgi:hypothetical protein